MKRRRSKGLGPARVLSVRREVKSVDNNSLYPKSVIDPLRADPDSSVCVIRSVGGIGDILMITPALRNLKEMFPEITLTFAVDRHTTNKDTYYELVKNALFIDYIIDARYVDRKNYDLVVDVSAVCIPYERKGLPPVNRIDLFGYKLGSVKLKNPLPFYKVEDDEREWAEGYIGGFHKPGSLIGLHTASNEEKRTWDIKQQLSFVRYLSARFPYIRLLVFDWNHLWNDWKLFPNVLEASSLEIRKMAALIEQCDLFICPDSGPMHIAGALSIPSLAIFGSIPPKARISHYPTHESIVLEGLSCLGCWYDDCPYNIRCMKDITGSAVGAKAIEVITNAKKKAKITTTS